MKLLRLLAAWVRIGDEQSTGHGYRQRYRGTSAVVHYLSELPTDKGSREPRKATNFGLADPNNAGGRLVGYLHFLK
jgi:hypothetical protein